MQLAHSDNANCIEVEYTAEPPPPQQPTENFAPKEEEESMPEKDQENQESRNPTEAEALKPPATEAAVDGSNDFETPAPDYSAEFAAVRSENEQLKARLQQMEEEVRAQKLKAERSEVTAFAADLAKKRIITEGKIEETVDRIMAFDNTAEVSFAADKPAATQRQIYMEELATRQPLFSDDLILGDDRDADLSYSSTHRKLAAGYTRESIDADKKIRAYCQEKGLDPNNPAQYGQAMLALDFVY